MKKMKVTLVVEDENGNLIKSVFTIVKLSATDDHDNMANAARHLEQINYQLFRELINAAS